MASLQQGHWYIMQHFEQSIMKTCTLIVGFDHFGYLPPRKSLWYRLNRRMDGSKNRIGFFGGEKNLFPPLKRHHDSFAVQPLTYRNTDYAILAPSLRKWQEASELEEYGRTGRDQTIRTTRTLNNHAKP